MDGLRNYPEEPEQRWYSERYVPEGETRYDGYRIPDPRYEEAQGWGVEAPGEPAARTGADLPPLDENPDRYRTQAFDRDTLSRSSAAAPVSSDPVTSTPAGLYPQVVPASPAAPVPPVPASGPPAPRPSGTGDPVSPGPAAWGSPSPGHAAPGHAAASGAGGPASPSGGPAHSATGAEPGGSVYRTRRAGLAALLAGGAIFAELLLVRVLLVAEFGSQAAPGAVLAGLFALAGVPLVALGLHALCTGAGSAGPAPGRLWLRVPLAYLPVGLVLLVAAALAVR